MFKDKFTFLIFFILIRCIPAMGQVNGEHIFCVTGIAVDSLTGKGIEDASIAVYDQQGRKMKNDISRESGRFKFYIRLVSSCRMEVVHLSYQKKTIIINPTDADSLTLGRLLLLPRMHELKEVAISAKKNVVSYGLNKITYSVALDSSNKGISALDMIQKVPLIEVAGNQLVASGRSNLKLFLDGKEVGSSSSYVAFLKSLPAGSFSKVEVNTSPDIRYQQEGVTTIINLTSDKKLPKGIFAGLNTGISSRLGYTYGGFVMSRLDKLYIVATLNRDNSGQFVDGESIQQIYNLDNSFISSLTTSSRQRNSSLLTDINATYNISPASSVRVNFSRFGLNSDSEFIQARGNVTSGDLVFKNLQSFYNLEGDYERVGRNKHIFSLALKLANDSQQQSFERTDRYAGSTGNEYTVQADYIIPKEKWKIDLGTKLIRRNIDRSGTVPIAGYSQDIFRLYGSAAYDITKKHRITLGLISDAAAFENVVSSNKYYNLLFQGNYSFLAGKSTNISFSFNQQVKRPGLKYIAPAILVSLPQNILVGNQELSPEMIYNYKTMVNGLLLKKPASASIYFTHIPASIIEEKMLTNEGVLTTYSNRATFYQLGTSVFYSYPITKKISLRLNGDIGLQQWKSQDNDLSNRGLIYKIFTTLTYNGFIGCNTQLRFFNYSRVITPQGYYGAYYDSQLSVSRAFFHERFSCKATLYQPFLGKQQVKSIFDTSSGSYSAANITQVRYLNLSLSYELGNVSKAMSNRSQKGKRAENDDLKIP